MSAPAFRIRDVFAYSSGEYASYSALMDRLVEVCRAHAHEIPVMYGMQQLLDIGRERGWISYDAERDLLVVSIDVPAR